MAKRLLRACVLLASSSFVPLMPANAAPVTLNLQVHLTEECRFDIPDCSALDQWLPLTITYDDADFILNAAGQLFMPSLWIDVPITPLVNPFSGPVEHEGHGVADFAPVGPVSGGTIEALSGEGAVEAVIVDGFLRFNRWTFGARILNAADFPPHPQPPTAADFEALLQRGDFEFVNFVYFEDTGSRLYTPESRVYRGRVVPEPSLVALTTVAFGLAWRRGFRRRKRDC
jgi:hypothetical protein